MKGMETKDNIDIVKTILRKAEEDTPNHIRGILIPEELYSNFVQRLNWICKDALLSKEYFKQINDMRIQSTKATHDFMTTVIKKIDDGTLIIKH